MLLKSKRLFLGLRANLFIQEFPFAFLEAFDNKQTMLKKLKSGSHNQSDCSGVLQQNNIHLKVYTIGDDLDNPVLVAQVEEDDGSMIPAAIDPTEEDDGFSDVGCSYLSAIMATRMTKSGF